MKTEWTKFVILPLILLATACNAQTTSETVESNTSNKQEIIQEKKEQTFGDKLSDAALSIIDPSIKYTPDYVVLAYPNGDVPAHTGVCTDVVIRAYRKLGIDLQQLVHEDMKKNFKLYPKKWGMKAPDKNIDHRRVPNLMTFFSRFGKSLPLSKQASDYLPGDVVTWNLPSGLTHIGIVVDKKNKADGTPMVVHNIGAGQVMENCLFSFVLTGHYRFDGKGKN